MMSLGLMNQGVNHLLDPDKYWWIAVLSDLWKEVGWGTILYLAGMSRIDPTFYEAARIDGASKLTQPNDYFALISADYFVELNSKC